MAGIGIGLGGFMDGWTKMGEQQLAEKRQKLLEKNAERQDVLNQREDAEYNRALTQRNEIDAINAGAKTEFDKRVAAGTEKADNFDQFFTSYAIPQLRNTYLLQNNTEMADRVQAWGESADAKRGGKFAMSAIYKAQTGDLSGALNDAIEAGKIKGYIQHGYEFIRQDNLVERKDGPTVGYRLFYKGADGKENYKDVLNAKVPDLIATLTNPSAAWQSQIDAQNAEKKRQQELQDYRAKKGIDQEFGTGGTQKKARGDAIEVLRKRLDGGLAGDEKKFDDLPSEEQERLISAELQLQAGQPGTGGSVGPTGVPQQAGTQRSGRKVLVDTVTGQPVPPSSTQRPAAAPSTAPDRTRSPQSPAPPGEQPKKEGASRVPAIVDRFTKGFGREMNILSGREEAPSRPSQKPAAEERTRRSPELQRSENISYLIQEADAAISDGQQPERVAEGLLQNGIPREQWPTSLREALANKNRVTIGLNR